MDIGSLTSLYNFLCGTLFEAEGNTHEVIGLLDQRGKRKQDFERLEVKFGGLSTTLSSTGLANKSSEEVVVVVE